MNDLFMLYDRWNGLIMIVCGVYFSLLAYGYLPRKPKDPERLQAWHRKFGPLMKALAPCLILAGIVQLGIGLASEPVNPAARRVFNEFYLANEARATRGTTLESAEQFLADLRRIETAAAPAELRGALSDYISALDDGLKRLRASQATTDSDARMTEAKQRLSRLEEKYR